MKKLSLLLVATTVCVASFSTPVYAIKTFNLAWDVMYVEKSENEGFKKLAEEAKCNVCHVNGEKKTKHNPYGVALEVLLDKDNYKSARVKAEPEKVKEELEAAFKKVEDVKDESGKTFKERMEEGLLPGGDVKGQ